MDGSERSTEEGKLVPVIIGCWGGGGFVVVGEDVAAVAAVAPMASPGMSTTTSASPPPPLTPAPSQISFFTNAARTFVLFLLPGTPLREPAQGPLDVITFLPFALTVFPNVAFHRAREDQLETPYTTPEHRKVRSGSRPARNGPGAKGPVVVLPRPDDQSANAKRIDFPW